MLDRYELIDRMASSVDALADARGAQKCALIIELIQQLGALKKGLKDEEAARRREMEALRAQIEENQSATIPNNGEAMEV